MSKFQLVLLGIFSVFIVVGVVIFAFGRIAGGPKNFVQATVWGTMDRTIFDKVLSTTGISNNRNYSITYIEKNPETFDQELVEALASGTGPDLFFLPHDSILRNGSKVFPIPLENYPERDFKNNFAEVGEVFLTPAGTMALPFLMDPLVMYWNRDIFSNAGLSIPPVYWSEMYDLSLRLTKKDSNLNITESAAALGEYSNVSNAFELVSLLMMQAGSPLVRRGENGLPENLISEPRLAAEKAVGFYTEFSNPLKSFYSWNRSLPLSKNFFLAGDLALYFGFASELTDIRLKNPNLNFDVAMMPQVKDAGRLTTFGKVTGLAIVRNSNNIAGAFQVAVLLTSPKIAEAFSLATNLPPVRRDLLALKPSESYKTVFFNSAIQARTWLMPDPYYTPLVFKEAIESITGGRSDLSDAISKLEAQIDLMLPKQ